MEKKHKDLVITDLCGRLPHKVIVEFVSYEGEEKPWIGELSCKDLDCFIHDVGFVEIKPYLFPLSSMTEEQLYELREMFGFEIEFRDGLIEVSTFHHNSLGYLEIDAMFEWFNRNHFDYRGLIEKGLAIDATNKNIY